MVLIVGDWRPCECGHWPASHTLNIGCVGLTWGGLCRCMRLQYVEIDRSTGE